MLVKSSLLSLVTPSTSSATSAPNFSVMSASVMSVSSTTSCKSPAAQVVESIIRSDSMNATRKGWVK